MKRTSLIVTTLVLTSLLFVGLRFLPEARAATLYVGGAGPGNYTTIWDATGDANPGDTIFVYNGTYTEHVVITKTLSLIGEDKNSTIIDRGGFRTAVDISADLVNIMGFTITGGIGSHVRAAGIELDQVDKVRIVDNIISLNAGPAIRLHYSTHVTIADNTMIEDGLQINSNKLDHWNSHAIDTSNTVNGKPVYYWKNVTGGTVPTDAGQVILANCTGVSVRDQNVSNGSVGISLGYSSNNTIVNNRAFSNTEFGIFLHSSSNNSLINNTASDNWFGMFLKSSEDCLIAHNNVSGNGVGAAVDNSPRSTVSENTASFNTGYGITGGASVDLKIINNTAFFNELHGIVAVYSIDTTIAGNSLVGNGIHIQGREMDHWTGLSIDTSNTVNGKPVYYWKNVTGGTVPTDAGQVILANCTGVSVRDQNVSNGSVGISLGYSSNNTIVNNTISSNSVYGIYLWFSDNNTVTDNSISKNDYGISHHGSDHNSILGNSLHSNIRFAVYVILSENNTFRYNDVSQNGNGIRLPNSDNNTITHNVFSKNTGYTVDLAFSMNNLVHHNIFIDNQGQARDNQDTNTWDDGYPSGGNYWSDYSGTDWHRGTEQNIRGSDGIGDIPYLIDGDSIDRYPLVSPGTVYHRPPENVTAFLSGRNFENVTIIWNPSPDEPIGRVDRYDILRGENFNTSANLYTNTGSVPNGTHQFVDAFAGEGNPNTYFYAICAINMTNDSTCADNQAGKFTRPLSQGPNFVSIPLIQSNESIEIVLQTVRYDMAWSYDSSSQEWNWYMKDKTYSGGLSGLNHTRGIWVNVTEASNLTVAGIVPAQTTIELQTGWNLVSFPSFNSSYTVADLKVETGATRVEGYDSAPPYFLRVLGDADVLQAGYAYWIRVDATIDWIVEVSQFEKKCDVSPQDVKPSNSPRTLMKLYWGSMGYGM